MKKVILSIISILFVYTSTFAQTKDFLNFGEILTGAAFKEGTVYYNDEKMADDFMSYILVGKDKIFITSQYFDKRLEVPHDFYSDGDNIYIFHGIMTMEAVTINIKKGKVVYRKHIEEIDEDKVIFTADIDPDKSILLLKILKDKHIKNQPSLLSGKTSGRLL